jgi:copper chaperone CopZ
MITTLKISGTHCISCKKLLEGVILDVKGVKAAEVDFKTGIAKIRHENEGDIKTVKKEIDALGLYEVN